MSGDQAGKRPVRLRIALPYAVAFSTLSGILAAAAHPPHHLWPLAFFSWTPLLVALAGRRIREAALLGLIHGFFTHAIALYWLPSVVKTFGGIRPLGCIFVAGVFCVYGGLGVALAAMLTVRARRMGWPLWCCFALSVAAVEAFYPLVFPAFTASQVHSAPLLMQLADVGGPVLVGVPLTLVNVAIAEWIVARCERRSVTRAPIAIGLSALLATLAYGAFRIRQVDASLVAAPAIRIGIVQANTPHKKMGLRTAIRTYREATAAFVEPLDLVVWPETALSAVIQRSVLAETINQQILNVPGLPPPPAFPILSGVMLGKERLLSNSAVLFMPSGEVRGVYDKVHPLVFGEYVPFADRFPKLNELIPNAGRLTAGSTDQPALELNGHRITTLICYEDAMSLFTNDAVRATNGELIIDLTNDSWFGSSTAAAMHLGLAKFRSIEHRRYLVHAATSGVSAFVDPAGRVRQQAGLGQAANISDEVHWLETETVYDRIGDRFRWCVAAMLMLMILKRRRTVV